MSMNLPTIPAQTEPDPIFAAIEARKLTAAACGAARTDAAASAAPDADAARTRDLLRTVPTTLEGVRALVRYVMECEQRGDDVLQTDRLGHDAFLETLSTALGQWRHAERGSEDTL